MSYHGIQISGIALVLYALFAAVQGGALSDTASAMVGLGVLFVFVGALFDPVLERRFAAVNR